jgi:hypothetical protein
MSQVQEGAETRRELCSIQTSRAMGKETTEEIEDGRDEG